LRFGYGLFVIRRGIMISGRVEAIVDYHEATKHHYDRYARSSGYMDWQNQPNPFRSYKGAAVLPLPLLKKDPSAAYTDLYSRNYNSWQPPTIESIAGFLELSLGLSAWKESFQRQSSPHRSASDSTADRFAEKRCLSLQCPWPCTGKTC